MELSRGQKLLVVIGLGGILLSLLVLSLNRLQQPPEAPTTTGVTYEPPKVPAVARTIKVHVAGAVARPGVYELRPGSRAVDAVQAAGWLLPEADATTINLAAPVEDGQRVLITRRPTPPAPVTAPVASQPSAALTPGQANQPPPTAVQTPDSTVQAHRSQAPHFPVSLNSATESDLQAVPGIGEVTARRILSYRRLHGGFARVEDLLEIEGIGEGRLEQIRPYVVP